MWDETINAITLSYSDVCNVLLNIATIFMEKD